MKLTAELQLDFLSALRNVNERWHQVDDDEAAERANNGEHHADILVEQCKEQAREDDLPADEQLGEPRQLPLAAEELQKRL